MVIIYNIYDNNEYTMPGSYYTIVNWVVIKIQLPRKPSGV